MNQDINIKLFLELDNFVDFLLNGLDIFLLRNSNQERNYDKLLTQRNTCKETAELKVHSLLGLVFTSNPSEFNGLREGSNGGSWKNWKVKLLLLSIKSSTHIGCSAMLRTLQISSLESKKN